MLRHSASQAEKRYFSLQALIARRQEYEDKHPFPPYSTHKTDINFSDKNKNTLLHYAAMMGDMEKVQLIIKNGADVNLKNIDKKSAILLALENGHLEVAKFIYEKGANCTDLRLSSCVNDEQRQWLTEKIATHDNQCVIGENSISRAVEIGDIGFVQQESEKIGPNSRRENNNPDALLLLAAANGDLEMMQCLLALSADINGRKIFRRTALIEAIKFGQQHIIAYLLSFKNIDIDKEDDFKRNALMYAAVYGCDYALNKLLQKNPDVKKMDVDGNTVLHLAVNNGSPTILHELLLVPEIKNLLNVKNIYGYTPLDLAIHKGDDVAINILAPDMDITSIKKDKQYGHQPVKIKQRKVMEAMLYRLKLKYRDTEYFSVDGHCNGFAFLRSLYAARGMNSYYFSTLAMMAGWNGHESVLDANFYAGEKPSLQDIQKIPQAQYYKNLDGLFEQWTNDIIWFQHSTLDTVDSLKQHDRVQQYSLIKDKEEYEYVPLNKNAQVCFISFDNMHAYYQTRERFLEVMQFFLKMPANVYFELGGAKHATSGFINENSVFDYYDPNTNFQVQLTAGVEENIQRIMDYKYIVLNSKFDDAGYQPCNVRLFCFKKDLHLLDFKKFEIFSLSELPKNSMDVSVFQRHSPNNFTPLHVAVITRSLPCIEKLLQDGFCKINTVDGNAKTVVDIAINNEFYEALELFVKYHVNSSSSLEYILGAVYDSNMRNSLTKLLDMVLDVEVPDLFFKALAEGDLELVKYIHERGLIDLNKTYSKHRLALIIALQRGNEQIIEYLLQTNASLLTRVEARSIIATPLALAMKPDASSFDAVIAKLPDINVRDEMGKTPLYHAISSLNVDAVQKLISRGASLNFSSDENENIITLLYEVFCQHFNAINMWALPSGDDYQEELKKRELGERDCQIRFRNCLKLIMPALTKDFSEQHEQLLVKLLSDIVRDNTLDNESFALIMNVLDKKIINNALFTSLQLIPHLLSLRKYDKIKLALSAGAYVDAVFPSGNTALMGIIKVKDFPQKYDLISVLLNHGASVEMKNKDGKTVMDLVRESSDDKIKEIFRERGLLLDESMKPGKK